jgi:hypothetical protein
MEMQVDYFSFGENPSPEPLRPLSSMDLSCNRFLLVLSGTPLAQTRKMLPSAFFQAIIVPLLFHETIPLSPFLLFNQQSSIKNLFPPIRSFFDTRNENPNQTGILVYLSSTSDQQSSI